MKNHYLLLMLFLVLFPFLKGNAQETNKAITIPKTESRIGYRLQVPETILGDRNGGATDRTGKSFTFSSWVNIDQVTNDSKNKGCVIMGHGPQEHMNYNGSLILCIDENRNLKIISGAGNTYSKEFSGSTIALDTWTYLTLVYNDATHKVTVYKDGTLVGESGTQNTSLTLFGDDPTIFFVGGMGFSGCCDDFQFFKAALTAEEVKTAYETPESLASLTAWYNFNTIDDGVGSFLNKSTASAKASEKATFYKYTGTISSDPGLITGRVTEVAPTLVLGRTNSNVKHTITYNSPTGATVEVYNGTTLLASGTEVKEGTTLTVKIAITDPTKMLVSAVKVNGESIQIAGDTYRFVVAAASTITVELADKSILTAIDMPAPNSGKHYQFRFSDRVLGNYTAEGTLAQDSRKKTITMSAWVKPTSTGGDILGHVQKAFYVGTGSFAVRLNSGKLELFARCMDASGNFGNDVGTVTNTALTVNEWAFLTLVIDNGATTPTISLYKNGTEILKQNANRAGIGFLRDECTFFAGNIDFAGAFDEVQLWDKALTVEEINQSMNGISGSPANLLSHYVFNNKATDNTFPNQGAGGTFPASLTSVNKGPGATSGVTFTTIAPTFVAGHVKPQFNVSFSSNGLGNLVVKNGQTEITTGTSVAYGTVLTITATPNNNATLNAFTINGVDKLSEMATSTMNVTVTEALAIQATFSSTTSIDNESTNALVLRYDENKLFIDGMKEGDKLAIYNLAGNKVKEAEIAETDVQDLVNGCYLIKVTTASGFKTMKFIKR
ncbi:MAG: LamG-like jellyroll fold domain-containing protein [Bacteroides sp.]